MKTIPHVEKYMTAFPHTVNKDASLKTAQELMRTYGIRHLPVLEGGQLVGVLTDRDLKLAGSFKEYDSLHVEEVMTPEPYTVLPQAPIDQVVTSLIEHKYGCAIVQQENGRTVGILTQIDALRFLHDLIQVHYKN